MFTSIIIVSPGVLAVASDVCRYLLESNIYPLKQERMKSNKDKNDTNDIMLWPTPSERKENVEMIVQMNTNYYHPDMSWQAGFGQWMN